MTLTLGKLAVLAISLGFFTLPALSADDLIASELVSQAREWQQKSRDDLAAEIWRKLLRANPQHSEALVKLGIIEARAGNRSEADALYKRAVQLAKPPLGLSQLSAALSADKSTAPDVQRPPSQPKPEAAKQADVKQVDSVARPKIGKPVVAKTETPASIMPKKKAPTAVASAPPVSDSKKTPVQATTVDALNLTFSDSLGRAH